MINCKKMISVDEALQIIDKVIGNWRIESKNIPIRQAVGRTLVSDQFSRLDLPPFNKSTMDGYAILKGDNCVEYRLLDTISAGNISSVKLLPGTTVKVMTGAPIPEGAGKVVKVEHANESDGIVTINKFINRTHIYKKGVDIKKGQKILSAGARLNVLDVASLIGCGIMEVQAARRLKAAIISTGNEIVDNYDQLTPGKIMNTNLPLLAGLSRQYGFDVTSESSVPDLKDKLESAIREALNCSDMVILSGGVSMGDFDYVPQILKKLGLTIHFSRVSLKPGKPVAFASGEKKLIFGLPGNPVSTFVTFHLYVLRAASLLSGGQWRMREFKLRLAMDYVRHSMIRREYVPCKINNEGKVEIFEYHGSAHLAALMQADGFLIIPAGAASLKAGDEVIFTPMILPHT